MPTGTECKAERQSKLSELIERISDISGIINNSRNGLDNILDRLLGEEPCNVEKNEAQDCRTGTMGQLEDSIDILNRSANQIKSSINRLSGAGVA